MVLIFKHDNGTAIEVPLKNLTLHNVSDKQIALGYRGDGGLISLVTFDGQLASVAAEKKNEAPAEPKDSQTKPV